MLITEVVATHIQLDAPMTVHGMWNLLVRSIVARRAFLVDENEQSATLHARSVADAQNLAPVNRKFVNMRSLQRYTDLMVSCPPGIY